MMIHSRPKESFLLFIYDHDILFIIFFVGNPQVNSLSTVDPLDVFIIGVGLSAYIKLEI